MKKVCSNAFYKTRKITDKDINDDIYLVKVFIDGANPFCDPEYFIIGYKVCSSPLSCRDVALDLYDEWRKQNAQNS